MGALMFAEGTEKSDMERGSDRRVGNAKRRALVGQYDDGFGSHAGFDEEIAHPFGSGDNSMRRLAKDAGRFLRGGHGRSKVACSPRPELHEAKAQSPAVRQQRKTMMAREQPMMRDAVRAIWFRPGAWISARRNRGRIGASDVVIGGGYQDGGDRRHFRYGFQTELHEVMDVHDVGAEFAGRSEQPWLGRSANIRFAQALGHRPGRLGPRRHENDLDAVDQFRSRSRRMQRSRIGGDHANDFAAILERLRSAQAQDFRARLIIWRKLVNNKQYAQGRNRSDA